MRAPMVFLALRLRHHTHPLMGSGYLRVTGPFIQAKRRAGGGVSGSRAAPEPPRNLATDFKAFVRRIRNEMFMLLKALADRNYEDAVACVRSPEGDPWTEKRFEAAMEPYFEEFDWIDLSPQARGTRNTIVREDGEQRWQVMQKVIDPEG